MTSATPTSSRLRKRSSTVSRGSVPMERARSRSAAVMSALQVREVQAPVARESYSAGRHLHGRTHMTPFLAAVGVVASDMARSLHFYRQLALDAPDTPDEGHVHIAFRPLRSALSDTAGC